MNDQGSVHIEARAPLDKLADIMVADILDLSDGQFIEEMRASYGDERPLIDQATKIFDSALKEFAERKSAGQRKITTEIIPFAAVTLRAPADVEETIERRFDQVLAEMGEVLRQENRPPAQKRNRFVPAKLLQLSNMLEMAFAVGIILLFPLAGWAVVSFFSQSAHTSLANSPEEIAVVVNRAAENHSDYAIKKGASVNRTESATLSTPQQVKAAQLALSGSLPLPSRQQVGAAQRGPTPFASEWDKMFDSVQSQLHGPSLASNFGLSAFYGVTGGSSGWPNWPTKLR